LSALAAVFSFFFESIEAKFIEAMKIQVRENNLLNFDKGSSR